MSAYPLSSIPSALGDLYQLPLWQQTLFSAPKVHGILFGVSCVPEIPMPESWLGYVFHQHAKVPTEAALQQLTKALMDGLAQVLAAIYESDFSFCQAWVWDHKVVNNEASPAVNKVAETEIDKVTTPQQPQTRQKQRNPDYAEFLQGVLLTHQAQESQWLKAWETMPETEQVKHSKTLQHCLSMLTTFADIPLALNKKSAQQRDVFVAALPQLFLSLPDAIEQYAELSGQVASYLPNQFEQFSQ